MGDMQFLNTFCIVSETFDFVSRLYRDCKDGRYSEENAYEEVYLPGDMKNHIRYHALPYIQENDDHLGQILRHPDCLQLLNGTLRKTFDELEDIMDDAMFLKWTIICCFACNKFLDRGLNQARDITILAITELCKASRRYSAFRSLGCII